MCRVNYNFPNLLLFPNKKYHSEERTLKQWNDFIGELYTILKHSFGIESIEHDDYTIKNKNSDISESLDIDNRYRVIEKDKKQIREICGFNVFKKHLPIGSNNFVPINYIYILTPSVNNVRKEIEHTTQRFSSYVKNNYHNRNDLDFSFEESKLLITRKNDIDKIICHSTNTINYYSSWYGLNMICYLLAVIHLDGSLNCCDSLEDIVKNSIELCHINDRRHMDRHIKKLVEQVQYDYSNGIVKNDSI